MITINAYNSINIAIQSNFTAQKNTCAKCEIPNNDEFIKKSHRNPSFQGLSNKLKDGLFSKQDIERFIKKYPKSNGWIGSIPKEWEDKIKLKFNLPRKEHSKKIKEFYDELGGIITELRYFNHENDAVLASSKKINQLFKNTGIVSEKEEIEFFKIGGGSFGIAYQLGVKDDLNQYVIKVFRELTSNNEKHGNPIEANAGIFVRTVANEPCESNGNKANKCQFARVFTADTRIGYIIEQHIGDMKELPENFIDFKRLGVELHDSSSTADGFNSVNGYNIEYGGMKLTNPFIAQSKIVREVLENICNKDTREVTKVWDDIYLHKLYGDKTQVLIGLSESLKYLKQEDRFSRFNKLANINDINIDKSLANLLGNTNLLPEEQQFIAYEKLLVGADNEIKEILADKIYSLPEDKRFTAYEKLLDSADSELKQSLADNIFSLPEEKQFIAYDKLLVGADNEIKKSLADNICSLSTDKRFIVFEKLLVGADNKIKEILADKIYLLSEDERFTAYEKLLVAADNEIKKSLADNICSLSTDKRFIAFEKLLVGADNKIKEILADKIYLLPEEKQFIEFEKLLVGADNELKQSLADSICILPIEKRYTAFEKLFDADDKEIIQSLAVNIFSLPEEKQFIAFEKLLDIADDKIINVLKNMLVYLNTEDQPIALILLKNKASQILN
jgi:hypothetical protein